MLLFGSGRESSTVLVLLQKVVCAYRLRLFLGMTWQEVHRSWPWNVYHISTTYHSHFEACFGRSEDKWKGIFDAQHNLRPLTQFCQLALSCYCRSVYVCVCHCVRLSTTSKAACGPATLTDTRQVFPLSKHILSTCCPAGKKMLQW